MQVAAEQHKTSSVDLQPQPSLEETVTVVASTRTDKRLEDQPMRVEVLAREEIEEKMLMTPGDIVMMLNEMGGMRVQTTSPSLGAASVRIQGMRGRYTRVLSDGLPLFGEVGGLGLLQIPPMDLGQVEVIKGVASALYGAGAMGGVINLLSRRPGARARGGVPAEPVHTRCDGCGHVSLRVPSRAVGVARCSAAATGRRPTTSTTMRGPISQGMREASCVLACSGMAAAAEPSSQRPALPTRIATAARRMARCSRPLASPMSKPSRRDATTPARSGQFLIKDRYVVTARAAIARQSHDHQFGEVLERDRHDTAFGEAAIRGTAGRQTWVAGLAIERDAYTARDVPRFDYDFIVPGAFAQYDVTVSPNALAVWKRPA